MKTVLIRFAWLPLLLGQLALAQTAPPQTAASQAAPAVEDFKPSSLNQPGKQYPQVNSERRVRARVVAPQAQSVMLDLGGVKYPLTKGEDGAWVGDSRPQDEGFHYYQTRYRWRPGSGSRQPVLLRRQPLGQRPRSPRQGSGLLCRQGRAPRPTARDPLLFQERQCQSPLLRLHPSGL